MADTQSTNGLMTQLVDLGGYRERHNLPTPAEERRLRALEPSESKGEMTRSEPRQAPAKAQEFDERDIQYGAVVLDLWSQAPPQFYADAARIQAAVADVKRQLADHERYASSPEFRALSRVNPQVAQQRILNGQAEYHQLQEILQMLSADWGKIHALMAGVYTQRWEAVFKAIPAWRDPETMNREIAGLAGWARTKRIDPATLLTPQALKAARDSWKGATLGRYKKAPNERQRSARHRPSEIEQAHAVLARHGLRL